MKVLLSAIACNPYLGSENYFGWAAVKAIACDHDLWVLTGHRNIADLKRAAAEGLVPDNVTFVFAGQSAAWHPNRMRARLQGWREYVDFSQAVLEVARKLHAVEKFDLAHHVTYATWRVASPLGQLGIPLIFGPVGGYERFPLSLLPILSPIAGAFELARMLHNGISKFSPTIRRCLRETTWVFATNPETENLVKSLRGSDHGVAELSAAFYSAQQIQVFSRFARDKNLSGPLRLFAGGNMEGRKGVALALEALAEAKKDGVKFQYRLGGHGPEAGHFKAIAARLGLLGEVVFADSLQGEAYQRELGETHIFLLPSFRESAGLTMMEAMLAGAVPVVADCGGPGWIVTEECGCKIPVTNRRQMVRQLAETIITLDRNRQLLAGKGRAASARIAGHLSETNYRNVINGVYNNVVKNS